MRVVHVMKSDPVVYGMQRVLLTELVQLRSRGVDARFLVLHENRLGAAADRLCQLAEAQSVPVIRVPVAGRFALSEVQSVRRAVEQSGADLVHAHGYKGDLFGLLAARLARVPVVGEVHGWLFPKGRTLVRFYEWLDVQVLKRMDLTVVLSEHYRKLLLQMGFSPSRLRLVPSGINTDELRARVAGIDLRGQLGVPPDSPTVGMLTRLSPEKGVDLFVEAMAFVARVHPNVRGIVFGDGPLEAELKALGERLGLREHLIWAGYVDAAADALRSLDVLAQTSRYEALPQVLMEAMVMERPTVVTPVGGCPELVRNGETGFVVPAKEPELIAAAICRLLADPDLRLRMGQAGARRMEQEYSMDRWFQRTLSLYEEAVRG
jgi:glycosyltransferase involved in cell wall biosynthesis